MDKQGNVLSNPINNTVNVIEVPTAGPLGGIRKYYYSETLIVKGPFSSDEDELIKQFVAQNGAKNWPEISKLIPHRNAKQCRERWFNHLSPNVVHKPWTYEEDLLIYQRFQKYGSKWAKISKALPGRTDCAIKNRYNSSISKRLSTNEFSDTILLPEPSKRQKNRIPKLIANCPSKINTSPADKTQPSDKGGTNKTSETEGINDPLAPDLSPISEVSPSVCDTPSPFSTLIAYFE